MIARGLASAALVILLGASCHRADSRPGREARSPVARWREADAYAYTVELSSRAVVAASERPIAFALRGNLSLRARSVAETTSFLASLTDVEIHSDGGAAAPLPVDLEQRLRAPWGFDVALGQARSLHLAGDAPPFLVGILSTLAAAFQLPQGPPVDGVWRAREIDATGAYEATYTPAATPDTFTKARVAFAQARLPLAAGGPLNTMTWAPKVLASRGLVSFRGDDLAAVTTHDEIEVALTPSTKVTSTTDLALTLVGRNGAAPARWDDLWASTQVVAMGSHIRSEAPARELDARRAGNVRFADVLAELERESRPGPRGGPSALASPAADESTARAELAAFGTVVSVLRTRPEAVDQALAAIDRGSPARRPLLDALGAAATDHAEAGLVREMLARRAPTDVRRDAAYALGRSPRPTARTVDAFLEAVRDPLVSRYAVYGLGTQARRLRQSGDTSSATRALDALLARLAQVTHASERVDVLRALANSGDGRAMAAVRPFLDDTDASLREAAVAAVGRMPNPEVDELLAYHLRAEEDAGVRGAALDAATTRGPTDALALAVESAATDAPDSTSRVHAVRILQRWSSARPEVRSVLLRVAQNDSREAVREAATAALAR